MDKKALADQFLSFYGISLAPYDLVILSSQEPGLLVLIEFITQYECKQLTDSYKSNNLVRLTKQPHGISEALTRILMPIAEKYSNAMKGIKEFSHLSEKFFELIKINLFLRLACCACVVAINSDYMNGDVLGRLNEFSGRIGLFRSEYRDPLQCSPAKVVQVESSVTYTPYKPLRGAGRRTRRRALQRKRTRKQRGGSGGVEEKSVWGFRWFTALICTLNIFGTAAVAPDEPDVGKFKYNQRTGAWEGGVTPPTITDDALLGSSFTPFAIVDGIVEAHQGYLASVTNLTSVEECPAAPVMSSAVAIYSPPAPVASSAVAIYSPPAPRNALVALPPLTMPQSPALLSLFKYATHAFVDYLAPPVAASPLPMPSSSIVTASGNITILDAFALPPVEGLEIDVLQLDSICNSTRAMNALYYLGLSPEVSMAITNRSSTPIAAAGYGNLLGAGVASDSIVVGARTSTPQTIDGVHATLREDAIPANLISWLHTHPLVLDRLGSFPSPGDIMNLLQRGLFGQGTYQMVGTQTGLLVYSLNPQLLTAWQKIVLSNSPENVKQAAAQIEMQVGEVPLLLRYAGTNNRMFNPMVDPLEPGHYRIEGNCRNTVTNKATVFKSLAAGSSSCDSEPFRLQVLDDTLVFDHLVSVAFVPDALSLRGNVNIPVYSAKGPWVARMADIAGTMTGPSVPTSAGFAVEATRTGELFELTVLASNNTVLPNLPTQPLGMNVSCFDPQSIVYGFSNSGLQQRCLATLTTFSRSRINPDIQTFGSILGKESLGVRALNSNGRPFSESLPGVATAILEGMSASRAPFVLGNAPRNSVRVSMKGAPILQESAAGIWRVFDPTSGELENLDRPRGAELAREAVARAASMGKSTRLPAL